MLTPTLWRRIVTVLMKKYRYLFGPVPSRRFGQSLGVDLVPLKKCTMDCVFCQLGHTPRTALVRKEYVPVEDITGEIAHWLASGATADYITLSGSGEPTLHSRFGKVIDFIHSRTSIPVLLLTNSSLLHLPAVRRDAARADVVKISLSAWNEQSFKRINRPGGTITFARFVKGLIAFRAQFKGLLIMEVFLVKGLNSDPESAGKIATIAAMVRPDRIQFNTAVRPPADKSVKPVADARMAGLAALFRPKAELIPAAGPEQGHTVNVNSEDVLSLLRRHACTARQIATAFGLSVDTAQEIIEQLLKSASITKRRMKNSIYYLPL